MGAKRLVLSELKDFSRSLFVGGIAINEPTKKLDKRPNYHFGCLDAVIVRCRKERNGTFRNGRQNCLQENALTFRRGKCR